ncbi:MAG: two-component system response regulator FixJ [Paracoccaceae bacterium]|jgi:two-component system response regulator FixJ
MSDPQTVFIVDDDNAVLDSLGVLLESLGFRVELFESGASFLAALDENANGCLILDVRMPGLSGLEIQERLTDRNATLPVIIMTGHGDLPMAVKAMKAGAVDFVEKPFDADGIAASVNMAMARSAENIQEATQVADINQRLARLTTRERQVLDELVVGNLNKVIAYNLDISPRTVEIHRARTMEKMQARNLAHLVRLALTVGATPME